MDGVGAGIGGVMGSDGTQEVGGKPEWMAGIVGETGVDGGEVTRRPWWRRVLSGLVYVLLSVLIVLAVCLVVIPKVTHGAALTVLTGSMRPGIEPGDIVVVAGVEDPSRLEVGDVITYLPYPDDPTLITHRIIGVSATGDGGRTFTTQGDANSAIDDPVMDYQVRGRHLFTVPKLGRYINWGQGHVTWVPAAIGVVLLVYAAGLLIVSYRAVPEGSGTGGAWVGPPMGPRHCRA
jgi:signal peptidase